MLPHLESVSSERSDHRWIRRAAPVVAAVMLIAASVAFMSYAALAAPVAAHHADHAAIVAHHHPDGAIGFDPVLRHTCRHDDCAADAAAAFHTCRHGDACHHACALGAHPGHHGDGCPLAGPPKLT